MKHHTNRYLLALLCLFIGLSLFTTATGQIKRQTVRKPMELKLPDLTVSVQCPGKAYPGQELRKSIKVKISNIGTAGAKNFAVDIFLAKDKSAPKQSLAFSRRFKPYVLLQGGREQIRYLAPRATTWVTLHGLNKVPEDTPPGNYYIGVYVDSTKSVKELLESNNIDWSAIWIGPHITDVYQPLTWEEAPVHEMKLKGTGFGSVQGGKSLKMGSYALTVLGSEWHPDHIWFSYPGNIAHGKYYKVYMMEGGSIISNKYNFFLKMVLFGSYFFPHQGPPGTAIHADTVGTDSSQGIKKLMIGGTEAQIHAWSSGGIDFIVPNLPPGTYNVYIKKSGQTLSNVVTFTITAS